MTQQDVAALGGPSPATLRQLEGGSGELVRTATIGALEDVLGWSRGSVRKLLHGGEPSEVAKAPAGLLQTRETSALELILQRLDVMDDRLRRVEHRRFSESGRKPPQSRPIKLDRELWQLVDRRAELLGVSPDELVAGALEQMLR